MCWTAKQFSSCIAINSNTAGVCYIYISKLEVKLIANLEVSCVNTADTFYYIYDYDKKVSNQVYSFHLKILVENVQLQLLCSGIVKQIATQFLTRLIFWRVFKLQRVGSLSVE